MTNWLYQVTGPKTRRYLRELPEITHVYSACEPYFERGHAYHYESVNYNIYDAASGKVAFGVTVAVPNYDDYCGRCNVKAQFVKMALVCPQCRCYIAGI
jgi:hypothetical protein